jgi:formylglycine-generating enzyme
VATDCHPDHHPERIPQQARLVELLAAGVRPCLPRRTVALAESVEMTFAWIPPGTFLMGSPPEEAERGDNETRHSVTLTEGFYLGIHPVTQAQWQAVMGNNPSHFQGENLPVETVSWEDCQKFCKKLSQMDGKRYRLPTEAEWEYACRAGTTTPFHFGETIDTDQANYNGNYPHGKGKKGVYRQQTTPVDSFPPSGWGLFDMHGNVWEWCADWFDAEYYKRSPRQNPQGPEHGKRRVLRGGSWNYVGRLCRAAFRDSYAPGGRGNGLGFRVVLVVGART